MSAPISSPALRHRAQPAGRRPTERRSRSFVVKGHAAPALYATWAAFGLMPRAEALTCASLAAAPKVIRTFSTSARGNQHRFARPRFLRRHRHGDICAKSRTPRVHALLGDGELQEGEVWEGAMRRALRPRLLRCHRLQQIAVRRSQRYIMGLSAGANGAPSAGTRLRSTATTSPASAFDAARNERTLPTSSSRTPPRVACSMED